MKKIYFIKSFLTIVLGLIINVSWGQGTETFDAITGSASSYLSRSWTGNDGSTWTATNGRTSESLNGDALTLNDDNIDTYIQSGTISGGIGDITISTQRKFSGGSGTVSVFINDIKVGDVAYGTTIQTNSISGINVEGDIVIKIWNDTGGSSSGGADRVAFDDVIWTAFSVSSDPEPSNHVTSFTTTKNGTSQIDITWTDNDGANPAAGFLILASTGAISPPVDGTDPSTDTDLSDGSAAVKVASAVEVYSFTGLLESTTYNFEIYPYSNAGANIDFKTDGTVPSGSATTDTPPYSAGDIVITEIMYNSIGLDEEWIEIYNNAGENILLDASWELTNTSVGWAYNFDGTYTINDGEFATIQVGSSGAFPFTPDIVRSSSSNQLTNSSSLLTLSHGIITIDQVTYDDGDDASTDNGGPSYEVIDPTLDNSTTAANWAASNVDGGSPGVINSVVPFVWTGAVSSDWSNADNWNIGVVPSGIHSVTITDQTNEPIITSDIEVDDMTIELDAVLTITTNSLKVNGDLTLTGDMSAADGASFVPMGTVLGAGTATITRGTTFDDATGQYSVIGSPITGGNTSDLGASALVYAYDETVDYDEFVTDGGNRFNEITVDEAMAVGDAYFSAFTGDASGDVIFAGTPNSGNIDVALVYNFDQDGGGAGFNLVSNPYTAAISYAAFTDIVANPDIDGTLYFWVDEGSNTTQGTNNDYMTVTGLASTGKNASRSGDWDDYIRSAQGFFVKATVAGTVSFTPSMMGIANNDAGGFYREAQPEVLRFSLSSAELSTEMVIGFTEEATADFDRTLDAYKIKGNKNLQVYSRMEAAIMAINALPELTEERTVAIGFDAAKAGTYTLELADATSYSFTVLLRDNLLDKVVNLTDLGSYSFETSAVSNSDRFDVVFAPNAVLSIGDKVLNNDLIVFSNGNVLNLRLAQELNDATVKIYNINGTLVKELAHVRFAGKDVQTAFNKEGLFIMTVQSEGKIFVKKFVTK